MDTRRRLQNRRKLWSVFWLDLIYISSCKTEIYKFCHHREASMRLLIFLKCKDWALAKLVVFERGDQGVWGVGDPHVFK